MEELSIKIKIGDRIYPMKVGIADEAYVRAASKLLNDKIQTYKTAFAINDPQDLLAMVAFDCLVDTLRTKETYYEQQLVDQVYALQQLIEQELT